MVLCCLLNLSTVFLSSLLLRSLRLILSHLDHYKQGPFGPPDLYLSLFHTLPSPQKIVNFLNTNQIIHQQILAHRINGLFCSYVTVCSSLNTPSPSRLPASTPRNIPTDFLNVLSSFKCHMSPRCPLRPAPCFLYFQAALPISLPSI